MISIWKDYRILLRDNSIFCECKSSETAMATWNRVENTASADTTQKRYQLTLKKKTLDDKKEDVPELRRYTYGERNPCTVSKTILLVGETGSGKSTLINTMVNYVMGVEWENQVWFEIMEQDERSLPQSRASLVTVYDVFGFEGLRVPYSLTIVDTPGYEDPKWNKEGNRVAEKLHHLFKYKNGIGQIDAVCLVLKATENCLSEKQKCIFDEIATLFGKDMEDNTVVLLTHSDGGPATNALEALKTADIKCAKDEKNQPVHFLVNIGPTVTTATELDMNALRNAPNTNMDGMDKFSEFLGQVTPQEVKMTIEFLTEQEHLKAPSLEKIQLVDEKDPQAPLPRSVKSIIRRFDSRAKDKPAMTTKTGISISETFSPGSFSPKTKPRTIFGVKLDTTTPGEEVPSKETKETIRNSGTSSKLDDIISKSALIHEGPPRRNSGTSSKLDDIISKSALIHEGPPRRYQLVPKKQCLDDKGEEESKLRKWTIGEKDPNKVNRTVLLVGETGAGKTTMINAMVNYIMGVEREDNIWFEITNEGNKCQTESQTSEVIAYDIFGFEGCRVPYSLTIIDTPGYGDTRGIQEDRLITERLHDLFRSPKGIDQIDAVGFVVKASTNRLSDRQRYIFDAVLSLFGKDMKNQIVALISNSDGVPAKNALQALENAKIKCAKNKDNEPVHFLFNNRQTEIVTNQKEERAMNLAWEVTKEGMDEFSEFLGKVAPQKLKMTVDVLTNRIQLEAFVNNLQQRIEMIEGKQALLKQTRDELMKHKKEMDESQNFVITVTESYKERVTIEGIFTRKAVCCIVCEENCHYPGCTLARSPYWCEVMKDGHCMSCTGRCPVSNHVRENWRFVQRNREITKTHDDIKRKYRSSLRAAAEKVDLMACLKKELDDAVRDKARLVEESYQCVVELEEIALRGNSLSTYVHLDFLIEKLKEKRDIEKAEKLERMQSCGGEGQKKGMDYLRTKLGIFWQK
ncbi:uncharacterized protein LOC105020807 isoform X2 [Esox lucius]|uniref:AAA+ ATPase domain-containing protein n=1 Tax=Esox lucius TaxID=8010 RepID=A0A6Q2XTS9_ESOLU|nr:uncharacterized protein LOC105020807 isoform X2 [Esox lucius]